MREGLQVVRSADRFRTRTSWLDSRSSFSFGPHYDPGNLAHGPLLAFNEERVRSGHGFDDHPHVDTEIVTWVLHGSLVHQDSAGHRGVTSRGQVQRMSAGRGVVHAERNDAYRLDPTACEQPVHYVQMWLRPDVPGGEPSYGHGDVDLSGLEHDWLPVVSGSHADAPVTLGASATLWVTVLAPGASRVLPTARWVHLFVTDGDVMVESAGALDRGDAIRVWGEQPLRVTGGGCAAELLVWALGNSRVG